jgi:hypothetical protein
MVSWAEPDRPGTLDQPLGGPAATARAALVWRLVAAGAAGVAVLDALRWRDTLHPDWLIARGAGSAMLGADGLRVYATHPRAQMGPLALVLALLPRPVYLVLVAAAIGPVLVLLADAGLAANRARWTRRSVPVAAAGAALAVVPWTQLAWKGHADDALVLLGVAVLVTGLCRPAGRRRAALVVAGVVVAVAGKPTGLALLPVSALAGPGVLAATGLAATAIWAPFAVADLPGLLAAGRGVMTVAPGSLPSVARARTGGPPPVWVRAGQLAGGLALAGLGAARRRPSEGIAAAFCLRALLEANPAPAYSIPLVLLAIAVDAGRRVPWATGLAAASFWLSQPVLDGGPGGYRLAALAALLTFLVARIFSRAG